MTARVSRLLPGEEAAELLDLTREIADGALAPRAPADEAAERFPRDVFGTLGRAGLLSLPYPRSTGAAAGPARSASRSSRSSRPAGRAWESD